MNDDQLLRYSRHILLDEIGIEGQERILAAHVLIIGAGGLGVLILTAISRSDMSMLLVGAVLVSLLAIIADLLLQTLQRALTPEGLRP